MSNEKRAPGGLGYRRWNPTQFYRDLDKPLYKDPYLTTITIEHQRDFSWLRWFCHNVIWSQKQISSCLYPFFLLVTTKTRRKHRTVGQWCGAVVNEKFICLQQLEIQSWEKTCSPITNNTRWWFQILFIFTPTWRNDPIWLVFFKWVEKPPPTTNCRYFINISPEVSRVLCFLSLLILLRLMCHIRLKVGLVEQGY